MQAHDRIQNEAARWWHESNLNKRNWTGVRCTEQAAHTPSNALPLVMSSSGTAFDNVLKKTVLSPWFS